MSKQNECMTCISGGGLIPEGLLCEYAVDPLGIDTPFPRFSWKVKAHERGDYQTACQVLVSESLDALDEDTGDMWDSGRMETRQSVNVTYSGKPLLSGRTYYWKVLVWNSKGEVSHYSKPARFEMGFLSQDEWKGEWITHSSFMGRPSSPMFRREFIMEKEVARARAYISGLGYYELRINGSKVGDHVLDPGWTDYTKKVLYVTYDVTPYLKQGANVIGVMLGNGWFGSSPQMILKLNIEFVDGTTQSIVSDRDWVVATNDSIVENSIYNGETYDARLEKPGWDMPGYEAKSDEWSPPIIAEPPGGIMVSQLFEPIKVVQDITPISINSPRPGIYVYDLGQNISGWARLKVSGRAGTRVVMRFAELIYEDGTINRENLRTAAATDVYILKGEGIEVYEPRFTYHGFRYIQVEGFPWEPSLDSITGRVVRSSVEQTGKFRCSNELINKIQQNAVWTEANNLHSIPTDCSQRDERLGWLNDMTVRAEEAVYNFHLARLYSKWVDDISDTQGPKTGAITDTAPFARYGRRPADPVASSYLVVPWLVYLHYGDRRILEKHYEGMKKWEAYLGRSVDDYIVSYSYYGDWSPPLTESVRGSIGAGAVSATTPGILMSTGFYYYNAILMSKMAWVLGKLEEEREYISLAERIKEAFNRRFFNRETNQYATGSQSCHVFPLFLGLVPEESKAAVIEHLVNDIVEKHNGHLTTGNLCSKYIMDVLTEVGRADVAYVLATQTTYPSWGYMVSKGATTMWERWEYVTGGWQTGMASHDHPMIATISAWFYKALGGILVDEEGPGIGRIIIKPHILEDLRFVECSLNTVRGLVQSNWKRYDGGLTMDIVIPWNASARVCVPVGEEGLGKAIIKEGDRIIWKDGKYTSGVPGIMGGTADVQYVKFEVGSGTYHFECSL